MIMALALRDGASSCAARVWLCCFLIGPSLCTALKFSAGDGVRPAASSSDREAGDTPSVSIASIFTLPPSVPLST